MRNRIKWGDGVIIALVLFGAAALALWLAFASAGDRLYAEVWQNGELTMRMPLTDETNETLPLGGHNTIVLRGKTARMEWADCNDQVCVRTGTLTRAGQAAVCLPNRTLVKLVGEKTEVDAIVS